MLSTVRDVQSACQCYVFSVGCQILFKAAVDVLFHVASSIGRCLTNFNKGGQLEVRVSAVNAAQKHSIQTHAIKPLYTKTWTDKDTASQTAHARSQSVIFSHPSVIFSQPLPARRLSVRTATIHDSSQSLAGGPEDCGHQQAEECDPTRILVAVL